MSARLDPSHRYYAVAGQWVGTCEACGWGWLSIRTMLLATADDEDDAYEAGVAACGHDDVHIYDSEAVAS